MFIFIEQGVRIHYMYILRKFMLFHCVSGEENKYILSYFDKNAIFIIFYFKKNGFFSFVTFFSFLGLCVAEVSAIAKLRIAH